MRQVHDLRLARRVLDDGLAVGEGCGHHEILRTRDRDGVEHQPRAVQPRCARADVAAFDRDVRPHGLQSCDVNVDRPGADRAAAR